MTTMNDYALLAAAGYRDKTGAANRPVTPENWVPVDRTLFGLPATNPGPAGFSAEIYRNGSEVVISYQGTNSRPLTEDGIKDWLQNISLALGTGGEQLDQAALLYERVQKYFQDRGQTVAITVTGHSLGGGLAGLVSVLFNVPGKVFAPAPFENSANQSVAIKLQQLLQASGFSDSGLNDLINSGAFSNTIAQREGAIEGQFIKGEILEVLRSPANTLAGSLQPVDVGGTELGKVSLHSMQLHSAVIENSILQLASQRAPQLLRLMEDSSLYAQDLRNEEAKDFLQKLLEFQVGAPGVTKNDMLNRFGLDAQQIGQAGAIEAPAMREVAISALIEYYNFVNTGALDFVKDQTGGISFDRSTIELPSGATSRITGRLRDALEALIPVQVAPGVIAPGSGARAPIGDYQQWFIQGGSSPLQATAAGTSSAAMIGGTGGDSLTGGDGNDFIFGDAGGDQLKGGGGKDSIFGEGEGDTVEGGLGDDYVEGGAGLDTYVYSTGDGKDQFFDIDGQGAVRIAGTTISDAFKTTRTLEWKAEGANGSDVTLKFLGAETDIRGTLRIQGASLGGAGNQIDILGFAPTGPENTFLGINLKSNKRIELVVGQNSNP